MNRPDDAAAQRRSRRRFILGGAAALGTWNAADVLAALNSGRAPGAIQADTAAPGPARVIELVARRFRYEPPELALKVGERVVIAIRSLDFVHGMNIPDLGRRLDLVPGRVIQLELQPTKPGIIEFVCDNFCGDGHEEMHGRFVVSA